MAADIYEYGQAKAAPTEILLIAAESWAHQAQWPLPAEIPPEARA